jgi:hypothetical protein
MNRPNTCVSAQFSRSLGKLWRAVRLLCLHVLPISLPGTCRLIETAVIIVSRKTGYQPRYAIGSASRRDTWTAIRLLVVTTLPFGPFLSKIGRLARLKSYLITAGLGVGLDGPASNFLSHFLNLFCCNSSLTGRDDLNICTSILKAYIKWFFQPSVTETH